MLPIKTDAMKRIFLMLVSICISTVSFSQKGDSLMVMFWNVENFFDYTDSGTGESDKEFSSMGSRRWTKRRFYRKCDLIAKTIMWIGENQGRLPDAIGLAEIENRKVLDKLLEYTLLRKTDYGVIHYDSQDRRGIDVALLYRKGILDPLSSSRKVPVHAGDTLGTRDILHVEMEYGKGQKINLIVNHHPSKYGGTEDTAGKRNAAMEALRSLCDSLASLNTGPVLAMGDFNDSPSGPAFTIIDGILKNKAYGLYEKGEGTIRYEGKWDLIDMFLVSPSVETKTEMEIIRPPFLMTWDRKHPGEKPLRTYSGPRYIGGVSDHCPIILWYFGGNS